MTAEIIHRPAATLSPPAQGDPLPALTLADISAGYSRSQQALEGVSFTVKTGERVALVGPNGAGKSTLFKVIVGLMPHDTGEVIVHGHSHHAGDCPSIGYVPQRDTVDWRFPVSVADVVVTGMLKQVGWLRWPGRREQRAALTALDQVGLAGLASRPIADLSGGQQQRVFIARALAQQADVLLLDEPFRGVDVEAQEGIFDVLDHLRGHGATVLVSTHDLESATTRFDRILLLNRRLLADGPAGAVLTPERLAAAYGGRLVVWQNGQPLTVTTDDCCP